MYGGLLGETNSPFTDQGVHSSYGPGPKVKEFGSRPRGFESARRQYEKFQTKEIKTLRKIADKIEQEIKH